MTFFLVSRWNYDKPITKSLFFGDAVESMQSHGNNISEITLRGKEETYLVVGSVDELARKIEASKGRFVVDLTFDDKPKSA